MREKSGRLLILLVAAWLLTGCASSAPVAYYQLTANPSERPAPAATQSTDLMIGIGPLSLPEYLDRPQIVSRPATNRLELADRHRWAEPLGDNIARVLQENLVRVLGSERLVLYPWSPALAVDRQIKVEIIHCEAGEGGEVQFEARWTILDREGQVLLPPQRSSQRLKAAQPPDHEGQVAALSEALANFSAELAEALSKRDFDR